MGPEPDVSCMEYGLGVVLVSTGIKTIFFPVSGVVL